MTSGDDDDARLLPRELTAYLNRVRATVISFRRAVVLEKVHGSKYTRERIAITIKDDGEIVCRSEEHRPTREEAEAIRRAYDGRVLPRSINALKAEAEHYISGAGGNLARFYLFWDRRDGKVRMLQERIEQADGKGFVPHSLWDDGKWRRMEPDGKLPLWKPEKRTDRSMIMIHEGAKAAKAMASLTKAELDRHPWGKTLAEYEHWGLLGGALSTGRSDYDEIKRESPDRVVYVCDNDRDGKSALQEVSRHYGEAMTGVFFDSDFPPAWDMADPFPPTMFSKKGRFKGKRLVDYMVIGTRATNLIHQDKGRPYAKVTRAFSEEWIHVVTPEVYIHVSRPAKMLLEREFNNMVRPFSDVDDTARLLRTDLASKGHIIKYDPGRPPGVFTDGDGIYINTYMPGPIEPEDGDPAPWLEFMDQLCPVDHDRRELMRWCATLIARPEIKMGYGPLLVSETQGVGKGTLGADILTEILGQRNCSVPTEVEIMNSNFNYWSTHKRLAVIHEIYAGNSSKAYNTLKSIITDPAVMVSHKFKANYVIDNWLHVFACSNSLRALKLTFDDRRWFVPQITDHKNTGAYWSDFHDWLKHEGGCGIIMTWAEKWLRKNKPVQAGAEAPWSQAKKAVIEEGYSPGMTLVSNFLDRVVEEKENVSWLAAHTRPNGADDWQPRGVGIYDVDLVNLIVDGLHDGRRNSDKLEKPSTLRKVATAKGFVVHPEKFAVSGAGGHGVRNWGTGRLLLSDPSLVEVPPKEVVKLIKPLDVTELAREWQAF